VDCTSAEGAATGKLADWRAAAGVSGNVSHAAVLEVAGNPWVAFFETYAWVVRGVLPLVFLGAAVQSALVLWLRLQLASQGKQTHRGFWALLLLNAVHMLALALLSAVDGFATNAASPLPSFARYAYMTLFSAESSASNVILLLIWTTVVREAGATTKPSRRAWALPAALLFSDYGLLVIVSAGALSIQTSFVVWVLLLTVLSLAVDLRLVLVGARLLSKLRALEGAAQGGVRADKSNSLQRNFIRSASASALASALYVFLLLGYGSGRLTEQPQSSLGFVVAISLVRAANSVAQAQFCRPLGGARWASAKSREPPASKGNISKSHVVLSPKGDSKSYLALAPKTDSAGINKVVPSS
jgi:hypothetical protein